MVRIARVVAWIGLLVGVIVGFTALGGGRLGGLALTEPGSWGAWAAERAPVEVLFGILRLLVLGVAWYLLAVSVIGVVARVARARRMVAMADLVTVPVVRRMLQATMGLSLVSSSLAVNVAPVVAAEQTPAVVAFADIRVTDRILHEEPPPPPATVPWVAPDRALAPADHLVPAQPAREWHVEPGQHFWSIAEQVLHEAWDRAPHDDEIEPYWRALVAENRAVLADPDNPDLVYPGQVFKVPSPPAG